jgi:hypothetical protein
MLYHIIHGLIHFLTTQSVQIRRLSQPLSTYLPITQFKFRFHIFSTWCEMHPLLMFRQQLNTQRIM